MDRLDFLSNSIRILSNTPQVLNALLSDQSKEILNFKETQDAWSPKQIVGHLLDADRVNWIVRVNSFQDPDHKYLIKFDRFAHLEKYKDYSIKRLLSEFESDRVENVNTLKALKLSVRDLKKTQMHPELGKVTLHNLISTWTVHDLSHINQISRVMSRFYSQEIGVWTNYISVLKDYQPI